MAWLGRLFILAPTPLLLDDIRDDVHASEVPISDPVIKVPTPVPCGKGLGQLHEQGEEDI